jgi:hypothetical protein
MFVGRKAAGALLAVCAAWLGGCGDGLGECDPTKLGGDPVNGLPYEGQSVVATKCSGSRCHSEAAMGDARVGAPADLNFDVVGSDDAAVTRNIARVVDWAEDIWDEIDGGSMPPPVPAGSGELSSADKEKVRNWLACGAPKIVSSATSATWDGIWPSLSQCLGCHNSTMGATSGGGFILGDDACTSYDNIFMVASVNASCGTRVTASNPGASLLYQKITGTQPMGCGTPMPPFGMPMGLNDTDPDLVARIQQWIASGAPKPAGCP